MRVVLRTSAKFILILGFIVTLQSVSAYAAETCESVFDKKEIAATQDYARRAATIKKYTLASFFDPNPENNLALQHPMTVVQAVQKYAQYIALHPPIEVLDPVYRARKVRIYPAFTGELPEARGKMIIGQYDAVDRIATYIKSRAEGMREGKVPLIKGPAGTGKTETLTVLDNIRSSLSSTDPHFFEYTFEWTNLDKIPALSPLLPSKGQNIVMDSLKSDMEDSPFVLLRPDMQQQVLDRVNEAKVVDQDYPLRPWTRLTSKDQRILEEIFRKYVPQIKEQEISVNDLSAEEYLGILAKHIRIVRKNFKAEDDANIIRFVQENPNYSMLFASEDIRRKLYYNVDDPLLYNLTGKVLKNHGGALALDEFFRNDPGLINTYLEVFQNGVVETDTGSAIRLDSLIVLTSNDESIEDAKEKGPMKAIINRTIPIAMRSNLHPQEISKVALVDFGLQNFYMRKLKTVKGEEQAAGKILPVFGIDEGTKTVVNRINELYPLPDIKGRVPGVDGRYAVYYKKGRQMILIAPHTLEMLGLVVSATRLVTDVSKMGKYWSELNVLSANSDYFINVKSRLDIIMGNINAEESVRKDLEKASNLLEEGKGGIFSRDIKTWLELSFKLALEKGNGVLSPYILDEAFKRLMDEKAFDSVSDKDRGVTLEKYAMVKNGFVLPDIARDIRYIVSGDGEKADRLYDTIEKEIVAMSVDKTASEWHPDDGSASQPINKLRLEKIKEKFQKLYSRPFQDGFLMGHLSAVSGSRERIRNKELLDAIQAYLVDTEVDITESAQQIHKYYEGYNRDPKVEKEALEAESRLGQYGYDKASFVQAINFWYQMNVEKAKVENRR